MKTINRIAHTVDAYRRCIERDNREWTARHADTLDALDHCLPSGGGFDAGSKIDREKSTADKIVIHTSYHHMSEHGYYDGWTEHAVTVTPSFIGGFDIKVGGRNRNDIKEYIGDAFAYVFDLEERVG